MMDSVARLSIGDTSEDTITDARRKVHSDDAEFRIASISDDLAAQIKRDGRDGQLPDFRNRLNGFIVEMTGR
jgi:hypothetical protein